MDLSKIFGEELENINKEKMEVYRRQVREKITAIANVQKEIAKLQASVEQHKKELKELSLDVVAVSL